MYCLIDDFDIPNLRVLVDQLYGRDTCFHEGHALVY